MPRPSRSNPKTKTRAIELRKDPTPAEAKLWSRLRKGQLEVTFRRQHAIGNFIPDFVCIQKKLIIELDGSQHLEQEEYDQERTKYLESQGYKVIRFWNNDVMDRINSVLEIILDALTDANENEPHFDDYWKAYNSVKPILIEDVSKRGTIGSIDDFWMSYNSSEPDPYTTMASPDPFGGGGGLSVPEADDSPELLPFLVVNS